MKWYKRDPDAFVVGTVSLTDEQFRLYSVYIELWYSHEDDPGEHAVISFLPWNSQRFRRVREELVRCGKLTKVGEKFTPNRVESELKDARKRLEWSELSNEKRWNNNGAGYPGQESKPQPQPYYNNSYRFKKKNGEGGDFWSEEEVAKRKWKREKGETH